jgi:hypothetical protein
MDWSLLIEQSIKVLPYVKAGIALLKAFIAIENEEGALLRSLEGDIQALRNGPYNAGMIWLEQALKRDTLDEHIECIKYAIEKFIDACGIETNNPMRRALIEYRIGICWSLIGKTSYAADWLDRSYASADEALRLLYREWGIHTLDESGLPISLYTVSLKKALRESESGGFFFGALQLFSRNIQPLKFAAQFQPPFLFLMGLLKLTESGKLAMNFEVSRELYEIRNLLEEAVRSGYYSSELYQGVSHSRHFF